MGMNMREKLGIKPEIFVGYLAIVARLIRGAIIVGVVSVQFVIAGLAIVGVDTSCVGSVQQKTDFLFVGHRACRSSVAKYTTRTNETRSMVLQFFVVMCAALLPKRVLIVDREKKEGRKAGSFVKWNSEVKEGPGLRGCLLLW